MSRIAVAAHRRPKRTLGTYRRHAWKSPLHGLLIIVPLLLASVTLSWMPLLLLFFSEAFVLAALPRIEVFRRSVDIDLDRADHAKAVAFRRTLLARMSESHRDELEHLEQLAARIRMRLAPGGADDASEVHADEWLGLGALLSMFARLAIAHRAAGDLYRFGEARALEERVATLDSMRVTSGDDAALWLDRRLAILKNRIAVCAKVERDRELLDQQLGTIGELIRWMHAQCARPNVDSLRAELEDALHGWHQTAEPLREVCTLRDEELVVDPEILEQGRLFVS